jgi:hypothetical protein
MSLFKNNSLAVALLSAVVFGAVALQGCSSDEQNTPAGGGSTNHAGSGGKTSTAGTGGKAPMSEGGAAGSDVEPHPEGGAGGEAGSGGAGGNPPDCDLTFDNSTLDAITNNGGMLPPLP